MSKLKPAFPNDLMSNPYPGLSKREFAAIMALQGILACDYNPETDGKTIRSQKDIAIWVIDMADELFRQLEKQPTPRAAENNSAV